MRFRYDLSPRQYDAVTGIELGDIETSTAATRRLTLRKGPAPLSLTCPSMLAPLIMAIPQFSKGKLTLVPKNSEGQPLKSKVEAIALPDSTPEMLPPPGTTDRAVSPP